MLVVYKSLIRTLFSRCLQLLLETYTVKSLPALKAIHANLNARQAAVEKSLACLQHEMARFSKLDEKYQELLKQYAQLEHDIAYAKNTVEKG